VDDTISAQFLSFYFILLFNFQIFTAHAQKTVQTFPPSTTLVNIMGKYLSCADCVSNTDISYHY